MKRYTVLCSYQDDVFDEYHTIFSNKMFETAEEAIKNAYLVLEDIEENIDKNEFYYSMKNNGHFFVYDGDTIRFLELAYAED